MKPSPAPWSEFETDDGDFGVKMDDAHSVIFGNLEGSCGICHANARLTSLAPELLDALENLVDRAVVYRLRPEDWKRAEQLIRQARGQ